PSHRSDGSRDRSIMLLLVALQCKLSYTTSFQTIHTNPASPKASCYSSRLLFVWTHTHTYTHTHTHTHPHEHRAVNTHTQTQSLARGHFPISLQLTSCHSPAHFLSLS